MPISQPPRNRLRYLRRFTPLTSSLALILLISSVYAPFLGSRLIRMAGDEKVYISQALEMEQAGHWFVQSLQDEPNYYKGPFHYVALRVGFKVFGRNPWAVLYMNLALLIAGALALAALVRKRFPEWIGGDVWVGAAFALGTGIYAHAWASQMEVETASLFAIGLWLLDRIRKEEAGWAFWCLAGAIGWIKSPLHSALLGTSALLFWAFQGDLWAKLKNPRAWLAVLLGISVCIAGYLPAFILDRLNFWNDYVLRETLGKGDTGQHWTVSVVSAFGFYLLPWMLLAFVSYAHFIVWAPRLFKMSSTRRLIRLAIAGFAPSVAFFAWHPYHFENYNLPVISAIWLFVGTTWGSLAATRNHPSRDRRFWQILYALANTVTAAAVLAIPIALTVLTSHFAPMPNWWPSWLLPLVWVGSLVTVCGFIYFGLKMRGRRPEWLAISSVGFLWGLSALFSVLGNRELVDLRLYLDAKAAHGETVSLGYYNLNRNIWSEWSYLNFWVPHEVHGLHTPEKLREAIHNGETILVTSKENSVQDFKDFMAKEYPGKPLHFIPWKRWRTQGRAENGDSLWKAAWDRRDLSLLETDYFIVETR
jgi:4-amino-4-deoxy-L-arabinose transferase-like glycosyltransferase